MNKGHAKILRLVEVLGEVKGRKKLQKIVYICKKMQVDFEERFQFHMYGPYSEELTLRVDELCSYGLMEEERESKGVIETYRYSLNDVGKDFLRFHNVELGAGETLIQRLDQENSRFLELVSTILFFENLPYEEMLVKIFTLKSKQRYTEEEVQRGIAFIDECKQITV
ncbi:YwgA family protein [Brevibacillus daliensis]|uniref:YwgA family protein n=1 Tax=Brevibacillus daliensis TaxID=2892995 RepID=UPI001E590D13|nr:YwgA family protein [Brevibacillus daliensis]